MEQGIAWQVRLDSNRFLHDRYLSMQLTRVFVGLERVNDIIGPPRLCQNLAISDSSLRHEGVLVNGFAEE